MVFSNERGSIIDAELDYNAQIRKLYKLEKSIITLKRLIDRPPYTTINLDYKVEAIKSRKNGFIINNFNSI
jgi:hypothetical protein